MKMNRSIALAVLNLSTLCQAQDNIYHMEGKEIRVGEEKFTDCIKRNDDEEEVFQKAEEIKTLVKGGYMTKVPSSCIFKI